MKNTAIKLFQAICGMTVVLALVAGISAMPVSAAANGIYIATATSHYRHPETGVIEDSGGEGSEILGQSMTESATYGKALVEVDPEGNTYVTIRTETEEERDLTMEKDETTEQAADEETMKDTKKDSKVSLSTGIVLGMLLLVGVTAFCSWYFFFYKKES